MRVIFMGTTPFSCVVLQQLLDDGRDVVAVVTQPDRPFGRKRILKASPVKEMALKAGIPVLQPERIRDAVSDVLAYRPDLTVTCAYGQIVPQAILEAPQKGSLNVHASLLPKFRGGAPIHWSIIRGETETGVTLMHMDIGMDSGDMIAKQAVTIDPDDTMGDVEAKLMDVSKRLIHDDLEAYLKGDIHGVPQDPDAVTYAYTIKQSDEFISFRRPVRDVYNHLRGLIPWPVGYALLEGTRVKLRDVQRIDYNGPAPAGTVLSISSSGLDIACEGGAIRALTIQTEGKPAMSAHDVANGVGREWQGKVFE